MIPWVLLDQAKVPGEDRELRLLQRGSEFTIRLGTAELMNSRRGRSEEALARLACLRLRDRSRPTILIGGLGMGFTLRAALAEIGAEARVVVAELVPAVVAWARGPMAAVFGDMLSDGRVDVRVEDVGDLIRDGVGRYDAILLDVDNGPKGLTRAANDALYGPAGLARAKAALRPGGVLAVWSAAPDRGFAERLRRTAGFRVEEVTVRAGGARHVVWLATRVG